MASFAITTEMDAYPEKIDELLQYISELAESTREAAGCLLHDICVDAEKKGRLMIFSAWESREFYLDYLTWVKRIGMPEKLAEFLKHPPKTHNYKRLA